MATSIAMHRFCRPETSPLPLFFPAIRCRKKSLILPEKAAIGSISFYVSTTLCWYLKMNFIHVKALIPSFVAVESVKNIK